MRFDDTLWRVEGPDLPAGVRVRVIAVGGTILRVEAA
ncbi:NfeD family protein [Methylobacterium oryzae CBMB20]